jgi:hypothetical protein
MYQIVVFVICAAAVVFFAIVLQGILSDIKRPKH